MHSRGSSAHLPTGARTLHPAPARISRKSRWACLGCAQILLETSRPTSNLAWANGWAHPAIGAPRPRLEWMRVGTTAGMWCEPFPLLSAHPASQPSSVCGWAGGVTWGIRRAGSAFRRGSAGVHSDHRARQSRPAPRDRICTVGESLWRRHSLVTTLLTPVTVCAERDVGTTEMGVGAGAVGGGGARRPRSRRACPTRQRRNLFGQHYPSHDHRTEQHSPAGFRSAPLPPSFTRCPRSLWSPQLPHPQLL